MVLAGPNKFVPHSDVNFIHGLQPNRLDCVSEKGDHSPSRRPDYIASEIWPLKWLPLNTQQKRIQLGKYTAALVRYDGNLYCRYIKIQFFK